MKGENIENKDINLKARQKIDKETKEWSPKLVTELPINCSDIPGFKAWINWNGFNLDKKTGSGHNGFDFAAYLTEEDKVVLGLPPNTNIRAVADGVVKQVLDNPEAVGGEYGVLINIEHGADDSGMFSRYVHVVPLVKDGQKVKKGEVIGTLYKDPGEDEGRLVHLHFGLVNGWGTHGTSIIGGGLNKRTGDPRLINEMIYKYPASPQGSSDFVVDTLPESKIVIANFKTIRVKD